VTNRSPEGVAPADGLRPVFEIRTEPRGDTVHLCLCGEFDLACEPEFRERLRSLDGNGFRKVVLDLQEVTFIDSTGLRLILGLWERSVEEGFALVLVKGPEAVHRVFEITGLQQVLPIVPDGSAFEDQHPA
jgi:anti-anti-sigma factor